MILTVDASGVQSMVKKAKLDIFEIAPDGPREEVQQDEALAQKGGIDVSTETAMGKGYPAKAMAWVRKPLFWIILVSVAYLCSVAVILIGFYQSEDEDAPAAQPKQTVSRIPIPEAKQSALFEGMVVDQKDAHGNIRIVFCNVAVELENHATADAVAGDRVDVRSAIHAILKKEEAKEGLTPEGRGRMKEKLRNGLNAFLGANRVKGVYFTSYQVD
jgi:flagellar basal body-associated protein FliL